MRARSGGHPASGPARSYHAAVVVIRGNGLGKRHPVVDELVVGWDADRDIVLDDPDAVLYARFTADAEGVVLRREPESEISLKVNDAVIDETRLCHGDVVQVGFCLLKFVQGPDAITVDGAFHDEIFRLSTIDPVTQVYNRRYFTEAFEREVDRARRYERSLSLLLVEVDGLSGLARDRGSTAADELIHGVAELVRARARKSDVIGHYEREVLALLLPEVAEDGAAQAAASLRSRIEQELFTAGGGEHSCTVSIGAAQLDPSHGTVDDLVRLCQNRLWMARDGGGNRVVSQGG